MKKTLSICAYSAFVSKQAESKVSTRYISPVVNPVVRSSTCTCAKPYHRSMYPSLFPTAEKGVLSLRVFWNRPVGIKLSKVFSGVDNRQKQMWNERIPLRTRNPKSSIFLAKTSFCIPRDAMYFEKMSRFAAKRKMKQRFRFLLKILVNLSKLSFSPKYWNNQNNFCSICRFEFSWVRSILKFGGKCSPGERVKIPFPSMIPGKFQKSKPELFQKCVAHYALNWLCNWWREDLSNRKMQLLKRN